MASKEEGFPIARMLRGGEGGGGLAGTVSRADKFLGVSEGNKDSLLLNCGGIVGTRCCNFVAFVGGGPHSGCCWSQDLSEL